MQKNNEAELISQHVGTVQKFFRGYLVRQEHLEGISQEKTELNLRPKLEGVDLNKDIEKLERSRKLELQIMQQDIEESYLDIKKRIFQNESLSIKEDMIKERREFIIKVYEESQGKSLPLKIQEIY